MRHEGRISNHGSTHLRWRIWAQSGNILNISESSCQHLAISLLLPSPRHSWLLLPLGVPVIAVRESPWLTSFAWFLDQLRLPNIAWPFANCPLLRRIHAWCRPWPLHVGWMVQLPLRESIAFPRSQCTEGKKRSLWMSPLPPYFPYSQEAWFAFLGSLYDCQIPSGVYHTWRDLHSLDWAFWIGKSIDQSTLSILWNHLFGL